MCKYVYIRLSYLVQNSSSSTNVPKISGSSLCCLPSALTPQELIKKGSSPRYAFIQQQPDNYFQHSLLFAALATKLSVPFIKCGHL